jgi:hypothetical protein
VDSRTSPAIRADLIEEVSQHRGYSTANDDDVGSSKSTMFPSQMVNS